MEKNRAIPEGYMTVGEAARKMNTTVRTLQYYDREGLLEPSGVSEGGRRLYDYRDIIKLHQIRSMKYLGFSLDDIKNRLVTLETPEQVAAALTEQAEALRVRIAELSESLEATEKLKTEILHMETVNWKKYADIIVNLQMKNEFYALIKHFDDETMDNLRSMGNESGVEVLHKLTEMCDKIAAFERGGGMPDSEDGMELAREWWEIMRGFSGGNVELLANLINNADSMKQLSEEEGGAKLNAATVFIEKASEAYFTKLGLNSMEEIQEWLK